MLDRETSFVDPPVVQNVREQFDSKPGQPKGFRPMPRLGEALSLDTHQREGEPRIVLVVHPVPHVNLYPTPLRVEQASRVVGSPDGLGLLQVEDVPVLARTTPARVGRRLTVEAAPPGQSDQHIGTEGVDWIVDGVGEIQDIIAGVHGDDRAGSSESPTSECVSKLGYCQDSRAARGGSATRDIDGTDPARVLAWHIDKPLILPTRHHSILRPAWSRPVDPGALRAGRGGRARPGSPIQSPDRSVNTRLAGKLAPNESAKLPFVKTTVGEGIGRTRPAVAKGRLKAELDHGGGPICHEYCLHQLEHGIFTVAQHPVVYGTAKAVESFQCFCVVHTKSMRTLSANPPHTRCRALLICPN